MCCFETKERDEYISAKIPQGKRFHSSKGLNCKELIEGAICGGVVRIKRINKDDASPRGSQQGEE